MSFFAPQAYTKETLSKAFEWLQHQPVSVKQAAANPDILVSIYLQAQRQGIQKIDADAPVSSRKFIDDLKTLSRDFAQFDDVPATTPTVAKQMLQQTAPVRAPEIPLPPQPVAQPPLSQPTVTAQPTPNLAQQHAAAAAPQAPYQPSQPMRQQMAADGFFSLDEKSLMVVRRVQERFNLSTPQEALRMIVAVGIEQVSRWN